MENRKSRFGAVVLLGVAGTLLVLGLILSAIAYSGSYNIGASFEQGHDQATLWSTAAFVKVLTAMTPKQYASYETEGDRHHDSAGEQDSRAGDHH